jgi:hypothetical protein
MSLFTDYRDSKIYAFIERVANFCSSLVFRIVDWLKRRD